MDSLRKIKVALDWTANTSHAALLAAQGKGFFEEEGFDVSFVEPTQEGAPSTPLQGVVSGDITFGVTPCDDLLSEHLGEDRYFSPRVCHVFC
jgi:ABC-type nitrate/sulfonate/bicarbonate transport system substrate-binding protein